LWKSSRRGKRYIKMKIILEKRRLRYTSRRCRTTLSVSGQYWLLSAVDTVGRHGHPSHVCLQSVSAPMTNRSVLTADIFRWCWLVSAGTVTRQPSNESNKKLFIQCCYYLCLLYYILFPRSVAGLLRQPSAVGCRLSKTAAVTDGRFTVGSYVPAGP